MACYVTSAVSLGVHKALLNILLRSCGCQQVETLSWMLSRPSFKSHNIDSLWPTELLPATSLSSVNVAEEEPRGESWRALLDLRLRVEPAHLGQTCALVQS
eukprot:3058514-Amphidinium_carterae.1